MGYIIKNTAALLTTKVTDAARKKMSEGKFNISYFQVGDSEVCYDCVEGENLSNGMVLQSEDNAQNLSPIPFKHHMLTPFIILRRREVFLILEKL